MISLELDPTIFLQMLQFIIITFIIAKYVVTPIKRNMDSRTDKIGSMNAQATNSIKYMEDKKSEYEAELQAVNKEISEFRNQLMKDASKKAQDMVDTVNSEIRAETEKAREEIRMQADSARKEIAQTVPGLSKNIMEAISN